MDYRVISIGTLSTHPLWTSETPQRTAHATTTLIRAEDKVILVDPGLPAEILHARLMERAGLRPTEITDVFLTNFRPAHRHGLLGFDHARWLISEAEREAVGGHLVSQFDQHGHDETLAATLKQEIALLQRCRAAPDSLALGVDLFPLPGYTPGTTGLLLPLPQVTVLIAGDAVPTVEHLEQGQVLRTAYDLDQARESLGEAIEIADWIIPGHDNLIPNMTRQGF